MSAVIFDLETVKQDDDVILANAPKWDIEEAKTRVPKNYKVQATIAGWLEEDRDNHQKNLLEKAALNPETATVAIAGFYKEGVVVQYSADNYSEKEILLSIMDEIERPTVRVLGWSLKGFDIPFFIKRCWMNDMRVPRYIFDPASRYPVPDRFVDMMAVFQCGNFKAPFTSLNNAMRACKVGEKADGSAFAQMWATDKVAALKYQKDELVGQAALYRKMGVDL